MRQRRTRQEWQALLDEQPRSGLSIQRFCQERALRVIPMGRKNYLFCWTELGAEQLGILQSLMVTCRLQGINPYTCLVDVLQRVGLHPASQVEELTPRVWKSKFADNFLTSDLAL